MAIPLQVLLLEDREEDARLILHELKQAGFAPQGRRVDNEADFLAALDASVEVILADFHVPGWDTMEALAILQVRAWDIPFIIVSGTIGEDTAVAAMRNGAADYLIKDRLTRLGPAVKRALEGRRLREEKRDLEAVRSAEREQIESTRRASEERYRQLIQSLPAALYTCDTDGRVAIYNAAAVALWGREPEAGRDQWCGSWKIFEPDGRPLPPEDCPMVRTLREGRPVRGQEVVVERPDGSRRLVLPHPELIRDATGAVTGAINMLVDITEQKQAADALRAEKKFSELLVESLPGLVYLFRQDGRPMRWNRALETTLEYTGAEVAQLQTLDFVAPEDHERARQSIGETLTTGRGEIELNILTKSGQRVPYLLTSHRFMVQGQPCVLGVGLDLSQRRRAEQQVRHLASFPELNPNPVLEFDDAGVLTYFNPAALDMARRAGQPDLPALLPPETSALVAACLATGQPRLRLETRHGPRTLSWSFFPIATQHVVHCYVGDITDRLQLEEQFRQSQKMEAIGQLAGGVAHDFNNILTVINGYGSLLLMAGTLPVETTDAVQQIVQASARAANLTRQLLAFSRRQVMQPGRLDLNEVITSLAKMLQRIVGEDVRLQLNLHPRPLWTHADAGMLDQVLMNLVINARDAMPGGGRLIIESAERNFTEAEAQAIPEATPGRHVGVRVTDTGSGIAPENLSHIFEPFFTTKEPGQGTGLGLATVFGIVKQHGGSLTVESQVGQGTTFQIYLPALEAGPAPEEAAVKPWPRGGTETILLVEDEFAVRMLNRVVLERAGYQVLEAPDGVEALRIWEQHQDSIRLLLTDIVMPEGVNGRELAARLQARRPRLLVIFTSGYSADIAGRELCLQEGQNYIQKPSSPQQLLETVRRCLDS